MIQQHGIARRTPGPAPLVWQGGITPEHLRADLDALRTAILALRQQVDQMEDRITRRLNEMLLSGTLATRPTAGVADRIFVATDQAPGSRLTFDSGTAWIAP